MVQNQLNPALYQASQFQQAAQASFAQQQPPSIEELAAAQQQALQNQMHAAAAAAAHQHQTSATALLGGHVTTLTQSPSGTLSISAPPPPQPAQTAAADLPLSSLNSTMPSVVTTKDAALLLQSESKLSTACSTISTVTPTSVCTKQPDHAATQSFL